ncbi:helix-turn-helix domain-containing protein [Parahaliea mediterranea]|uniref:helix-turn-helix domain-containing protein n=1 Tax=Parahaliea mediterranea TaxID=651086 RepID=UPI000E2F13E8|nr:helix-turn-helix domain-containing protein [Parahaliea mediterranea]
MSKRAANNATTWLLGVFDSDLKSPQKLVAAYLRTHMNDYKEMAWPSVGTIADKTGLNTRTVQRHLKEMCASGWLLNSGYSQLGTIRYAISTPPAQSHPPGIESPRQKVTPPAQSRNRGDRESPELTKKTKDIYATDLLGDEIDAFDAFWSAYPKKVDKKKSKSKFSKLKPDVQSLVIANVQARAKADRQWLDGYAPNPTTYLNGSRWEDEWERVKGENDKANQMIHGYDYE